MYSSTYSYIARLQTYGWSLAQVKVNTIVPKFSGALSCIGSGYIIYDVVKDPVKRKKPYRRIMIGMSIADLFSSFFLYFLSSWPIPSGYNVFAIGNAGTCAAQGFLGSIGVIGTPLYNCALATFYLLVLKYKWNDRKLQSVEKWFHIFPWVVSVSYALVGVICRSYMGLAWFCWIGSEYPVGCSSSDEYECIQDGRYSNILFLSYMVITVGSLIYVIVTMTITYKTALTIERNSDQYNFLSIASKRNTKIAIIQSSRVKTSTRILTQGILYSVAMFTIIIFPLISQILVVINHEKGLRNFSLNILVAIFAPLQGLFNLLIYLRPMADQKEQNNCCSKVCGCFSLKRLSENTNTYISTHNVHEEEKVEITRDDCRESILPVRRNSLVKCKDIEDLDSSNKISNKGNGDNENEDNVAVGVDENEDNFDSNMFLNVDEQDNRR
jgi:hypothetical protein